MMSAGELIIESASQANHQSYASLIQGIQDSLTSLGEFLGYSQLYRYSTIEIYRASQAVYELCIPPELYLDDDRIISDSESYWWTRQTPPYNYSISGAIFHAWKSGTIKVIEPKMLCVPFDLDKSINTQGNQESFLDMVTRYLKVDIQKCVNHIPTLSEKENHDFITIELEKIYKNQLKLDNIFMLFPLVIDQYWFLGCIFLGIRESDIINSNIHNIYRLIYNSLLTHLISSPLKKEIRDSALEIAQKEIQKGTSTETVLSKTLKQYLPFPVGRRKDYPSDYLEHTEEFLISSSVFPDFKESVWIPETYNNKEVKFKLEAEVDSLFREIAKTIENLDKIIISERIKSENYRERAIAHAQKHLYGKLVSILDISKNSKSFDNNLARAKMISNYIALTLDMRQKGEYALKNSGEPYARGSVYYSLNDFFEILYVLVCSLIDYDEAWSEAKGEDLEQQSEFIQKLVRRIIDWKDDDSELVEIFQNAYVGDFLRNLEINSKIKSYLIKLPRDKGFFYPLFISFFEFFSNTQFHACRERVIINLEEDLEKKQMLLTISTKDEIRDGLLVPLKFYQKEKLDDKFIFDVIDKQFLGMFKCSLRLGKHDRAFTNQIIIDSDSEIIILKSSIKNHV